MKFDHFLLFVLEPDCHFILVHIYEVWSHESECTTHSRLGRLLSAPYATVHRLATVRSPLLSFGPSCLLTTERCWRHPRSARARHWQHCCTAKNSLHLIVRTRCVLFGLGLIFVRYIERSGRFPSTNMHTRAPRLISTRLNSLRARLQRVPTPLPMRVAKTRRAPMYSRYSKYHRSRHVVWESCGSQGAQTQCHGCRRKPTQTDLALASYYR